MAPLFSFTSQSNQFVLLMTSFTRSLSDAYKGRPEFRLQAKYIHKTVRTDTGRALFD